VNENAGIGLMSLLKELPQLYLQDISTLLLLPLLALIPFFNSGWSLAQRRFVIQIAAAVVIVPVALRAAGKFPVYYTWMIFIPLCGLTAFLVERFGRMRRIATIGVLVLAAASASSGLPARVVVAILQADSRDYAKVSDYVSTAITVNDIAYVDFQAYYPAKLKAKIVYLPPYLSRMSDQERAAVTIAVLSSSQSGEGTIEPLAKFLENNFGGNWKLAETTYSAIDRGLLGSFKLAQPYIISAFRRTPLGSGPTNP
jgi:hypothetical protein